MKKITLLVSVFIAGLTTQAQNLQAEANAPYDSDYQYSSQAVIWDQPVNGTNGIISDYSNTSSVGVYSADDFELTETTRLDSIRFYGFQTDGGFLNVVNGFDLYIYENLNGANIPNGAPTVAGSGVVELLNLDTFIPGEPIEIIEDGSGGAEIVVDMYLANGDAEVVLPAGSYWIVAAPRINVADITVGSSRWNWYDAGVPANGVNEAHLIDPADLFGAGATSWTSFTDLGLSFGSVAFLIEGEEILGVEDNISELASVYPNPMNEILNIKVPSSVEIFNSTLYNVLGQDTGVKLVNGSMNTGDLERGMYILTVETSAGKLTQKIVKN